MLCYVSGLRVMLRMICLRSDQLYAGL